MTNVTKATIVMYTVMDACNVNQEEARHTEAVNTKTYRIHNPKPDPDLNPNTGGRCTNSRDPTWDNPKLRHFYWLLNRLAAIITNKNDVI